jgi:hypothetical protein
MITIPLDTLDRVAAHKPAGYKSACLAAGTVQNGVLHLDEAACRDAGGRSGRRCPAR